MASCASDGCAAHWKAALRTHAAALNGTRRMAFAPPVVLDVGPPQSKDHAEATPLPIVVVCPPWRYPHEQFAQEVRALLQGTASYVVTLPPPFVHPSGQREWFGYARESAAAVTRCGDSRCGKSASGASALMSSLNLDCADANELRASLSAVQSFVASLRHAPEVVLFGSSQGGSVVAHVGASSMAGNVRRAVAFQPAGFYMDEWVRRRGISINIATRRTTHGVLEAWGGVLGPVPRASARRNMLLFFGTRDTVAPLTLLELLRPSLSQDSEAPVAMSAV